MAIRNRNQKCPSSELLFEIATKTKNFENFRNRNQKSIQNQLVSQILANYNTVNLRHEWTFAI